MYAHRKQNENTLPARAQIPFFFVSTMASFASLLGVFDVVVAGGFTIRSVPPPLQVVEQTKDAQPSQVAQREKKEERKPRKTSKQANNNSNNPR